MVWTRPSFKSPTGEMVKCSVMKRVHLRELDAHVQAPNTCGGHRVGRGQQRVPSYVQVVRVGVVLKYLGSGKRSHPI